MGKTLEEMMGKQVNQQRLVKLIDSIAFMYKHRLMTKEVAEFLEHDRQQKPRGELSRFMELIEQLVLISPQTTKEEFEEKMEGTWWDGEEGYSNIFTRVFTDNN